MVLTRSSRASSLGQLSAATSADVEAARGGDATPPVTQHAVSPPVQGALTQMLTPHTSTSTMSPPVSATHTSITMTDQHLQQLLSALRIPVPTPTASVMGSQSNFARCSARFDGAQDTDVIVFIDAIEVYKECVTMDDSIALRGLPMLLTGMAGTWWQGVKHSVSTWPDAIQLLRQTFGPRLPPHKIYRELFSKEQTDEKTDVFVCRARALIAQLPPNTLPENPVQLDMINGLLQRRLRERVSRASFSSFAELLENARSVEDLLEESRTRTQVRFPASSISPAPSTSSGSYTHKARPRCGYCKKFGHEKDTCHKVQPRKATTSPGEMRTEARSSPVVCFGCGTPGVIRANCTNCKKKDELPTTSTSLQSLSVSAVGTAPIDARAVTPLSRMEYS